MYSVGDYFNGQLYGYQTDGDDYLMFYRDDWLNGVDEQARFTDLHGKALSTSETWEELDRHGSRFKFGFCRYWVNLFLYQK